MSQEEVKKLVAIRGNIKGQVTRFIKYLSNFENNKDYAELGTRLEKIEEVLTKFDNCQSELESLIDDPTHENEREVFEGSYYSAISKARSILNDYNSSNAHAFQQQTNFSDPLSNIKLPPLNLPIFDGTFEKWLQFYDSFKSIIHINKNLTPTQKFYYLLSSLKGEALQCIQSLQVSDSNYFVAWNLICERYQNSRLIINSHLKAIFEIPSLNKESKEGLRKLLDDLQKNIRALESLKQPVNAWDSIIIFLISSKLDSRTRREWELSLSNTTVLPSYTDFINFLSGRCQALEMIDFKTKPTSEGVQVNKKENNRSYTHFSQQTAKNCSFCNGTHLIYYCQKFLKLSIQNRINEARKLQICIKCLKLGHSSKDCKGEECRKCNKNHNTLLHLERVSEVKTSLPVVEIKEPTNIQNSNENINNFLSDKIPSDCPNTQINESVTSLTNQHSNSYILLSTANVYINDVNGKPVICRALLDSGSQSNYMTYDLLKKLGLKKSNINISTSGISKNLVHINHSTKSKIFSNNNNFQAELDFLILNKITEHLPNFSFSSDVVKLPKNLQLADPDFNISKPIDILLGANIFWSLLCVGQINLGKNMPILQKTHLGWIISGPLNLFRSDDTVCHLNVNNFNIQQQIERFWKIEECLPTSKFSQEEIECETHFKENTARGGDGKFIVKLPTHKNVHELGESRECAIKRLHGIEKRLSKNENLKNQYHHFMQEYIDLGHMSLINENEKESKEIKYYLPHHCVVKTSSLTTKCRVVFDASAKSSTGLSLNDVLKVGPTIQDELFSIVLRFRCHNYVITADVEKMYRMVMVNESDRDLQRILWRFDPNDEIEHFRLNTITYGTSSAPFLAVRSLHEIAYSNIDKYPEECHIILKDFYVDDLITGAATIEDAQKLKNNISIILSNYGFILRKWASNNREILQFPNNNCNLPQYFITDDRNIKTLGLIWDPNKDELGYSVNLSEQLHKRVTKRFILSVISQIFDPLGLIGPISMRAKLILQQLWKEKIDWDQTVPTDLFTAFVQFYKQILDLDKITIPRPVCLKDSTEITLHGFCDASLSAYGACIYLVSNNVNEIYFSQLLCAKSRIAPLKSISLPRLELCGAVLLATLMKKILDSLNLTIAASYLWTDSTIVLAWLAMQPSDLKTFVSNRISSIQTLTELCQWGHVRSHENPADIISRGMNPKDLMASELWWFGPIWLRKDSSEWPAKHKIECNTVPEKRPDKTLNFVLSVNDFHLLERFSSFLKLLHVTAYCLRFIHNTRNKNSKLIGCLSITELDNALDALVIVAQKQDFATEIEALNKSNSLPKKSRILTLDPFLEKGLLRVGGRLKNSSLPYEQKYPLLLSDKNPFTKLLIKYHHEKMLHAGPQLVLCSLRDQFWPLNGRTLVRGIIRKCLTCFKVNPVGVTPKMGDLPSARVNYSPPFNKIGLDFAGPFMVKDGKSRNRTLVKAYLSVFICFTTKAIHLELVGDLSSHAFLDALKRFISRRGLPRDIYSDNATNFVGAANDFHKIYKTMYDFKNNDSTIKSYLVDNKIQWHFIPPRSAHFGGLWEASVKSCKYHLKRIVGDARLTFEQLYTVLVQIEAILNSRPLIPLSQNPNDLEPLTPSHFLIGRKLTCLPQRCVEDVQPNRLVQFERLQQLVQHFWTRWHREYLSNLQARYKWKYSSPKLQPGMMVLVKEDHIPPFQWPIGRIVEVHPGNDDIVRVVSVKTMKGIVKRAFSKVCPLPVE